MRSLHSSRRWLSLLLTIFRLSPPPFTLKPFPQFPSAPTHQPALPQLPALHSQQPAAASASATVQMWIPAAFMLRHPSGRSQAAVPLPLASRCRLNHPPLLAPQPPPLLPATQTIVPTMPRSQLRWLLTYLQPGVPLAAPCGSIGHPRLYQTVLSLTSFPPLFLLPFLISLSSHQKRRPTQTLSAREGSIALTTHHHHHCLQLLCLHLLCLQSPLIHHHRLLLHHFQQLGLPSPLIHHHRLFQLLHRLLAPPIPVHRRRQLKSILTGAPPAGDLLAGVAQPPPPPPMHRNQPHQCL